LLAPFNFVITLEDDCVTTGLDYSQSLLCVPPSKHAENETLLENPVVSNIKLYSFDNRWFGRRKCSLLGRQPAPGSATQ